MEETKKLNFLEEIIEEDLRTGKVDSIMTRFPPEPNGYLHLGHAKSLCINFGLAEKYGGKTNLRYDDTNPTKEDTEYVDAIKEDIRWMGFKWEKELYASDYFDQLYEWAEQMINEGLAYVDDQTQEEISKGRGTVETPGVESPYRNRSIEENLRLFREMRDGKYADGEKVLRARIDMASPNMMFRDPILYRIKHASHHRTGDKWCIYPMYDFAHPIEDAIEGITHSICTLEFEDHRPLYDWVLRELGWWPDPPRQIEFARLNITTMIMSKRFIRALVEEGKVDGWDDPRLSTLAAVRRRGYTPEAIRKFCDDIGVSKADSTIDIAQLEQCVREDLQLKVPAINVVKDPIKVVIDNYPEGGIEMCTVENNSKVPEMGTREIPFGRELWVDGEDFMEVPPKGYHRLYIGNEIRLKTAYYVSATSCEKDKDGNVTDAVVTKSVDTLLDEEALKVVNASPKWKCGKVKGVKVRSYMTVPIDFKLEKKSSRRIGLKK